MRRERRFGLHARQHLGAVVAIAAATSVALPAAADMIPPTELLIYYGWPSSINGTFAVPAAAAAFGTYEVVVLGDQLELATHPDHQNTVDILADASMAGTEIFGYVDLGVSTQNLPMTEIEARIDAWLATGADGIFFDDFGHDYGVTRERQNLAVDYAHTFGLDVVANAWVPADALGNDVDATYNPLGEAPLLGAGDYYLFESLQISEGSFVSESVWREKALALETYRETLGVGVLAVTTNDPADAYDESKLFYAWYSALLYGYDAVGWGEYLFSADDAQAPHRARPAIDPGTELVSSVIDSSPVYWRNTDTGRIWIDTTTHAYGFDPTIVGIGTDDAPAPTVRGLVASPSPFSSSTTFRAPIASPVAGTAAVIDVTGRLVRTLPATVSGDELSVRWDGRDDAGRPVAGGVYVISILVGESRLSGRVTRLR